MLSGNDRHDVDANSFNDDDGFESVLNPPGFLIKVRLTEVQKRSKGGIYFAEQTRDMQKYRVSTGVVVAMGPDCYEKSKYSYPWCKVGDKISFSKDIGILFRENDQDYKLIKDDDVNGTFNKKTVRVTDDE